MKNNNFKAGDIILFSGRGFISNFIKLGTWSKWSHVGIMLNDKELIESTTLSDVKDVITGEKISGVQIVDIEERLKSFEGKVSIRRLKRELSDLNKIEILCEAMEFHGRPYEDDTWELLKSGIDWLPSRSNDLDTIFCSELVAILLASASIYYDFRKKFNDYSPKNISKVAKDKYFKMEVLK
jgi:hypothetical protein